MESGLEADFGVGIEGLLESRGRRPTPESGPEAD